MDLLDLTGKIIATLIVLVPVVLIICGLLGYSWVAPVAGYLAVFVIGFAILFFIGGLLHDIWCD